MSDSSSLSNSFWFQKFLVEGRIACLGNGKTESSLSRMCDPTHAMTSRKIKFLFFYLILGFKKFKLKH